MNIENFDSLYSDHYSEICRFCFKRVNNQQDAEDITDESFVKAFYNYDPRHKTSFRTFIFKIAKNLCLDFYKSKRYKDKERTATIDADLLVDDSLKTNGELLQQEILNALYRCLDKLEDEEQLSIRLYFVEQFTYQEIADIIEKSTNTAKNRVESGLKNLKKCLRKKGIIDS